MELVKGVKDILHPFGELDLLYYYSIVSNGLQDFLKSKELATKIALSGKIPKMLKRGTQILPIYIQDMQEVDEDFLKLRVGHHLKDVREKLNLKQILIWEYFFPRKMMDFFYACNREHPGLPIERIFIDIDKGKKVDSETAREVCGALLQEIKDDKKFNSLLSYKPFIMWTGNSFHIYLLLKKRVSPIFYDKYLSYSGEKNTNNFPYIWASSISKKTGIDVKAGHEKTEDYLIIDTSGTPSGKLARAPFSLHIKNPDEFDGIAIPLSEKDLKNKNLVKDLRKLTPERVVENLGEYGKLL